MSCLILTSLPPKITSCPHFSLFYTSCTLCIYTHYSNIPCHSLNFFFNIPSSYSPFLFPFLNSLQTIQLQLLFFPFILYLPIITNSILFFHLNSPFINFNYFTIIHLLFTLILTHLINLHYHL